MVIKRVVVMYVEGGSRDVALARDEVVGLPDPDGWSDERDVVPGDVR